MYNNIKVDLIKFIIKGGIVIKKNYVKDTYMLNGLIIGLLAGGCIIPILIICMLVEWIGAIVGILMFTGTLIGMHIKKK